MFKAIDKLTEFDITKIMTDEGSTVKEYDVDYKFFRDQYGPNISTNSVRLMVINDRNAIVFESEHTYKNWRYYAGFEYIDDSCINIIKLGQDVFYAWIFEDEDMSNRVGGLFSCIEDESCEECEYSGKCNECPLPHCPY